MNYLPKVPLDKAQEIAVAIILKGEAGHHKDYLRTVKLTEEYYRPLVTGEDMEGLYRKFDRRESEEDLKQRIRITQQITPSLCNAFATPARKVPAVKPNMRLLTYESDEGDKKSGKLRDEIAHFNGDRSLDDYIGEVLVDAGMIDPNAFLLYVYDDYEGRYEQADVYPEIVPSRDVWSFEYHNNLLHWILIRKPIEYEIGRVDGKKEKKTGWKFVIYTDTHHITFVQCDPAKATLPIEGVILDEAGQPVERPTFASGVYFMRVKDALYEVTYYEQKSVRVPAIRLGYVRDQVTGGRTMVNLWHPALPYLLKSIKAVSELDLSMALHNIAMKLEYRPKCKVMGCNGGHTAEGGICESCKGTGWDTITTSQEHITLPLPMRKDEMIDLSELTHYVTGPHETLKIMIDYVDRLRMDGMRAVYNSDIFVSDSVAQTATSKNLDMQSVYDALQPLANWYSTTWNTSVYILAAFKNVYDTLTATHRFPRNFKFESTGDLLATMKAAQDAGASSGILEGLNVDLAEQVYVDNEYALQRSKAMVYFDPFAGMKQESVLSIIGQNLTTKENKVLWSNMAYVFDMAEERNIDFYLMTQEKQRAIIDGIVAELIESMDATAEANRPDFGMELGMEPDPTEDPNADPNAEEPQDEPLEDAA